MSETVPIPVPPIPPATIPPEPDAAPAAQPALEIPRLASALAAAAPNADPRVWLPVLTQHLLANDISTPRRVAAFLGQATVESGGFRRLAEDTDYTTPERLCEVFPSRFTLDTARQCVGNPTKIANVCYAGKLGNGSALSGDGWKFRGGGLFGLTGRANYAAFARTIGTTADAIADWVKSPPGAAASACWFWDTNRLDALADAWEISAITARVNGPAKLGAAERLAASNAALKALGGA